MGEGDEGMKDGWDAAMQYKRERDKAEARRQGQKQATEDMRARLRAALQDRDKMRDSRDAMATTVQTLIANNVALEEALRRLASASEPVAGRLYETGKSQPAEVIRLGEATQNALAVLEE